MTSLTYSSFEPTGEETRLVVETLLQVVPGTQIVAVVSLEEQSIPGFELEPMVSAGSEVAFERISERVRVQLRGDATPSHFSSVVHRVDWGVLVEPLVVEGGAIVGALIVARHGRVWTERERKLVKAFSSLLSHVATLATREGRLLNQRRLDELVAQVAERLMSASATNRQETLDWLMSVLASFLDADVAFMRRNDLARNLTILESEWPIREDKPDPDPLGEVSFDADPIFLALKDLRAPYLSGITDLTDDYRDRAREGSGVTPAGGAAVPLLMGDTTWGVIGFLHFGLHLWIPAEINALQAVASMVVQLQARIDAEERTRYNADHDDLTGLPNRRALIAELKGRLDANRRTAVMVIDLDRFKVMNDYLGHGSGDRLLVTIADRIRTSIRANDFAARLGGDEFVFIVDKVKSEMEVLATAYRILDIIAEPVDIAGQEVSHTASIGIAISETDAMSGLDLLGWADVAMYAAKARGRNQAVVFDKELRDAVNERSRTELLLREAIDGDGLCLHFQPEVDIKTGELIAVEALVRWNHPERGTLAAIEFIEVAEETGMVTDIGRWVFKEACRQLGEWQVDYPDQKFVVRINMSPADFRMGDLVDFVKEQLLASGVPGNRLCIEITEYAMLDEPEKTAKLLRRFQALGLEIALDDFGTGSASMTELKSLPVDLLKLDMSFVRGVTSDPYDQAIVESIIRLGRALNKGVIAEGVETTEIVDKLLELGCHRGQGYLISRPVPPRDLAPIFEAGRVPQSLLHPSATISWDLADLQL
ncbi:MAG: EAL domain-containing protein [Acidobacteriota bacterium]|nr:EAL domain-containing protein [Acidobacteriota bacterium]